MNEEVKELGLDRPKAEAEPGLVDLLLRVLVAPFQARESGDPHDEQAVSRLQARDRSLFRKRDVDAVPRPHHPDGQGVGRVQANFNTARDEGLRLLGSELSTRDVARAGEHVVRQPKAEIRLRRVFLRSCSKSRVSDLGKILNRLSTFLEQNS